MRIIQICNLHSIRGGRELVAENTYRMLVSRGCQVLYITRDSAGIEKNIINKIQAFTKGIYSSSDRKSFLGKIREFMPEIVHIHGLHPLISPWIMKDIKRAGVSIVYSCHEFILTCPISSHLNKDAICERCMGGKEYWCALKNCRGSLIESIAYSIHGLIARKFKLFSSNVDIFIALTEFAKKMMIASGINEGRIVVLPNKIEVPAYERNWANRKYIAYVGRISPEKGLDALLKAACLFPEIELHIAGDGNMLQKIKSDAPKSVSFLGFLNKKGINDLYRGARLIVVPSISYEMCPLAILEAMAHGLPVIASNIGGLSEMVEDGTNGLLFEAGNALELAKKVKFLWDNPCLCEEMGRRGFDKVLHNNNEEAYYESLMNIYRKAQEARKHS